MCTLVDDYADRANVKSQILMHTLRNTYKSNTTTDISTIWGYGEVLELEVPNIHCQSCYICMCIKSSATSSFSDWNCRYILLALPNWSIVTHSRGRE